MLVFNRRNVANLLLENSMVNILNISQKTLRGSCCSSFIKHQPIRNSFHKISFYIISKMLVNILLNFNIQDYFYNEKKTLKTWKLLSSENWATPKNATKLQIGLSLFSEKKDWIPFCAWHFPLWPLSNFPVGPRSMGLTVNKSRSDKLRSSDEIQLRLPTKLSKFWRYFLKF